MRGSQFESKHGPRQRVFHSRDHAACRVYLSRMTKLAYLLFLSLGIHSSEDSARTADTLSLRPVRRSVVGGSAPRDVVAGRTVPITVQAVIAKGWHIYSLTQK